MSSSSATIRRDTNFTSTNRRSYVFVLCQRESLSYHVFHFPIQPECLEAIRFPTHRPRRRRSPSFFIATNSSRPSPWKVCVPVSSFAHSHTRVAWIHRNPLLIPLINHSYVRLFSHYCRERKKYKASITRALLNLTISSKIPVGYKGWHVDGWEGF